MSPNSSLTKNRMTTPIMASATPKVRLWRTNRGPVEAPTVRGIESYRMNRSLRPKGSPSGRSAVARLPTRTVTLDQEPASAARPIRIAQAA